MATRLRHILLAITVSSLIASLPSLEPAAQAAGLDAKAEADAKEATRLYKEGNYEDAAKLFARLTVDHPDMPIFERSLGACFYYLRKPEPALSNLRNYLNHRKDLPEDDKAVVDRWIDEMEKLRAQNAAPVVAAPVAVAPESATATATATGSVPESLPAPASLDLSAKPSEGPSEPTPIYKTWWFWTGAAAVVVAGTVTAFLLANRSSGACDGASLACMGVK